MSGREESSDAGESEEGKTRWKQQRVLEVGRSQSIPWVLFREAAEEKHHTVQAATLTAKTNLA